MHEYGGGGAYFVDPHWELMKVHRSALHSSWMIVCEDLHHGNKWQELWSLLRTSIVDFRTQSYLLPLPILVIMEELPYKLS